MTVADEEIPGAACKKCRDPARGGSSLFTWWQARKLKSSDPHAREAAVESVATDGAKAADRLVPMLSDADPGVRLAAVRALDRALPDVPAEVRSEVVIALRPLLGDADPQVQLGAALALAVAADDNRARNLLLECAHAATAAAEGVLSGASAEVSATVRLDAIRGLGRLKDPATRAVLLAILRDTDADVRGAACEALAVTGDARAVDVLRRIEAGDVDAGVKEKASRAASQIRERLGLDAPPKTP